MGKMRVGIIGLGLMGGSLSLAMREKYHNTIEVIGLDHNDEHSIQALKMGLVDKVVESVEEVKDVDVLFLSVPVDGIIAILQELSPLPKRTTVIDLGSTKAKIVASVPETIRVNFVAAHPMTGTEKFGPTAAINDLYRGKAVVLCDIDQSGVHQQETAKRIFADVGMKIFYMGAQAHDRHAAFISHMPHALSYALANSVMVQEEREAIIALAGGGFRDMSRIAKSSPAMWRDIFEQNQENLIEAIESFQAELDRCRTLVAQSQWDDLGQWMAEANRLHEVL
jgi:prephenate dehydrogenase